MVTIPETLAQALEQHRAGRLEAAKQVYGQILAIDPNQPEAIHLLGVIARQQGDLELSVETIRRAIELNGRDAAFHHNLGITFQAQGKLPEAVASYRRAVDLKPEFGDAHFNLAIALERQEQLEDAINCYRRVLELEPDCMEAHFNLGNLCKNLGRLEEAVAHYGRARQLKPEFSEAHHCLGIALQSQGKLDEAIACHCQALQLEPENPELNHDLGNCFVGQGKLDQAIACYSRALKLKPDHAQAHHNLGVALRAQGKIDQAIDCYRRALKLKPDFATAQISLGAALLDQGKVNEAIDSYRLALELKPNYAEVHHDLGNVLVRQGKLEEAVACYSRALELKPDFAMAHHNLGMLWLMMGKFELGWPEYEWRWKAKRLKPSAFTQPHWDGSPLDGRTILLHAEQGFGDALQFIRYASLIQQRGGRVIVLCRNSLVRLLGSCPGVNQVVAEGNELPAFDVHAQLLSLPGLFGTTLETIPSAVPYLRPPVDEDAHVPIPDRRAFRVGIVWQGNPQHLNDQRRSAPLAEFEPLAKVPGVELLSLQMGCGVEQLASLRGRFAVEELGRELSDDWSKTAAVVQTLDLLVCVDTAIAHLAGALGAPAWVALPTVPDWRWLLDRDDSPWYPTLRLFRQSISGDWTSVFAQMASELRKLLENTSGRSLVP